jgi:hypothetical protein
MKMAIINGNKVVLALTLGVLSGAPAIAQTIDFEDLPSLYFTPPAGAGYDIGSFYTGVGLTGGVQGVYSTPAYPAHSGIVEVWQSNLGQSHIDMSFTPGATEVSFWYTTLYGFTALAFDNSFHVVDVFAASPNTDGATGADSFADIISYTTPITAIQIINNSGGGQTITIDDLSVPDASDSAALLAVSGLTLFAARRKFNSR